MCDTTNLTIMDQNLTVASISGDHEPMKVNGDVEFLQIVDQPCYYIPFGIEHFFPFIKYIRLKSTGLKVLSSSDIKPFRYLIDIDLPYNFLEILDTDLFVYNTKLIHIYFGKNKIRYVGLGIFDPLVEHSVKIFLNDNLCTNAQGNLVKMKKEVEEHCPPLKASAYLKLKHEIDKFKEQAKNVMCNETTVAKVIPPKIPEALTESSEEESEEET